GITPELRAPIALDDDHDRLGAGRLVNGLQAAPQDRRRAEQREEVARCGCAFDARTDAARSDYDAFFSERAELGPLRGCGSPVEKAAVRHGPPLLRRGAVLFPDLDEPFSVDRAERLAQRVVDDRERHRARADADAE